MVVSDGDPQAGLYGGLTGAAFGWVGSWQLDKGPSVFAHAAVGCASASASGGRCSQGALAAGFGKLATVTMPDVIKANDAYAMTYVSVAGGTASVLGGGKFANGAVTAAFGYVFNCLAHECFQRGRDAERTFVNYLKANSFDSELGLGFNRLSDGQGSYFLGRPDIFSTDLRMVWDVKPDSYYGWSSGIGQIVRYTFFSGYSPGTDILFGGQPNIVLQGSLNTYIYRYGGNGLVIYNVQGTEYSPIRQAFQNQAARTLMGPFPPRRGGDLFGH